MPALIAGLRGSLTHRTSAQLYQRHHDAGDGGCQTCGEPIPCSARRHAAWVMEAAGDDSLLHEPPRPDSVTPAFTGYRLGGHGRRESWEGLRYDRYIP